MKEKPRIPPNTEDLEKAIKTYDQFAGKVNGKTPSSANRVITAAVMDMLPESIKPYAKAELAAQYMVEAQTAEADGKHAAAKVYTAIALHYMSQTGIRLDQVLPETAGNDGSNKYIESLFAPAKKYNSGKGGQ